jgi:hypothetical protein
LDTESRQSYIPAPVYSRIKDIPSLGAKTYAKTAIPQSSLVDARPDAIVGFIVDELAALDAENRALRRLSALELQTQRTRLRKMLKHFAI